MGARQGICLICYANPDNRMTPIVSRLESGVFFCRVQVGIFLWKWIPIKLSGRKRLLTLFSGLRCFRLCNASEFARTLLQIADARLLGGVHFEVDSFNDLFPIFAPGQFNRGNILTGRKSFAVCRESAT